MLTRIETAGSPVSAACRDAVELPASLYGKLRWEPEIGVYLRPL